MQCSSWVIGVIKRRLSERAEVALALFLSSTHSGTRSGWSQPRWRRNVEGEVRFFGGWKKKERDKDLGERGEEDERRWMTANEGDR